MNGVGVHGRPVHLFLNGLYWGIYTVVERPDDEFWATYFGGAPADYGVASHSGPVDGPQDRFNVLMQLAAAGGLDDPALRHHARVHGTRFSLPIT
ncbi:MAG: CotH kinase family protein [Caldilineaceae bacterium]